MDITYKTEISDGGSLMEKIYVDDNVYMIRETDGQREIESFECYYIERFRFALYEGENYQVELRNGFAAPAPFNKNAEQKFHAAKGGFESLKILCNL